MTLSWKCLWNRVVLDSSEKVFRGNNGMALNGLSRDTVVSAIDHCVFHFQQNIFVNNFTSHVTASLFLSTKHGRIFAQVLFLDDTGLISTIQCH